MEAVTTMAATLVRADLHHVAICGCGQELDICAGGTCTRCGARRHDVSPAASTAAAAPARWHAA
jgi:hypothetical protein